MLATGSPFPLFSDLDGNPLNGGSLFFGVANQNPETSPITVYWDEAGTQPAAQPISTLNGYPVRNGTPAVVFAAADYSLNVRDLRGALVFYAPTAAAASISIGLSASGGSALVGFIQSGTGAVARTAQAKMREWVTPEDFGAAGDGVADDTAEIVAALAAHSIVRLLPGKTYRITSRITVPSGKFIIGDGTPILNMDTGAGFFDATSAGSYAASNGVGVFFDTSTGGGLVGVRVKLSTRTSELIAGAVLIRSSNKIIIQGCEFDNFSKAKVLRVESSTVCAITDNYFHDCEISSATTGQLTAIDIDDNRPSGNSSGIMVCRNRFKNITASAGFIASFGYQTDAINVSYENSTGHTISENNIQTVGEGIDCFGADCVINGNLIQTAYNYGIKLVHGARRNVVSGNQIVSPGLGGIVLGGNTADANHTELNSITGNQISFVNIAGNWSAFSTFGIKMEDDGGTKFARKNLIADNNISEGGAMKYGILADNSSTSNTFRNNLVERFTIAEFGFSGGANYEFKSAQPANVQVYQSISQSVSPGSFVDVNLQTETKDSRSEFASNTYTAIAPRSLLVTGHIRTGAANSGKLWELDIFKNGVSVAHSSITAGSADVDVSVTKAVDVVTGDLITMKVRHNEAGAVSLTAAQQYTRLDISEVR